MAGIYVHIPFCHSKCGYCDFYSVATLARIDEVVNAIVREVAMRIGELSGETLTTLYIGGGTPSLLPPQALAKIVRALGDSIDTSSLVEFTIEANPEDVTSQKVAAWTALGVNRVSMGVQSFVPDQLRFMRRRHSVATVVNSISTLRRGGIRNLSLDLIFGIPGQTLSSWQHSLDRLFDIAPEHFSAYILSYPDHTLFHRMLRQGLISEVDSALIEKMYLILTRRAHASGYVHYEISSYAKPGLHSRHNSSYWDSTPYLGLGPAAASLTLGVRRENPASISRYTHSILSLNTPAFSIDQETPAQQTNDIIITRLRTAAGLPLSLIPDKFKPQIKKAASRQQALGNIVEHSDAQGLPTYIIPENRFIVSDHIIRDFIL